MSLDTVITHNTILPSVASVRPDACALVLMGGGARTAYQAGVLQALLEVARERGYWKLISRVFLFNAASRAMCRSAGFREVGIYEKHGQLDGRWLDVAIVERLIPENIAAPLTAAPAAAIR